MHWSDVMEPKKKSRETSSEIEIAEYKRIKALRGFTERLAVREEFFRRLDAVADMYDVPPGAIIEAKLRRFIEAEYPLALKHQQEQAAAGLKELEKE